MAWLQIAAPRAALRFIGFMNAALGFLFFLAIVYLSSQEGWVQCPRGNGYGQREIASIRVKSQLLLPRPRLRSLLHGPTSEAGESGGEENGVCHFLLFGEKPCLSEKGVMSMAGERFPMRLPADTTIAEDKLTRYLLLPQARGD